MADYKDYQLVIVWHGESEWNKLNLFTGWRDCPLFLIVGMLNTKDSAGFLRPLAPHAEALIAVTIPGEQNPLPAEAIAAAARSVGLIATTAASVGAALSSISLNPPPGRVLICGSLHLAGTVLAANG